MQDSLSITRDSLPSSELQVACLGEGNLITGELMADALGYCNKIGKIVRAKAKAGVPVKTIFASIQNHQKAPKSLTTFYTYYRVDMESVRAETTQKIANKVINTALNGDEESPYTHKSRELYLDRVGGWSKKEVVETREIGTEDEENEGAVAALMAALGKGSDS